MFKIIGTILILFSFILGIENSKASVCQKYLGTCDYYLCQESEHHCGNEGYFVGYGHHFCSKFFIELEDSLSSSGKLWVNKVAQCLQKKMEKQNKASSCDTISANAYSVHSECYVEADYCHLTFEDKVKILKLLKPELIKFKTQKEGLQVFYGCLKSNLK